VTRETRWQRTNPPPWVKRCRILARPLGLDCGAFGDQWRVKLRQSRAGEGAKSVRANAVPMQLDRAVEREPEDCRLRGGVVRRLEERRRTGVITDDILGHLMSTQFEGRPLSDDEIANIMHLMVIAGLDTVTSSLSCIISWFARHPDDQAWVVNEPALLPSAIEELMRFEALSPQEARAGQPPTPRSTACRCAPASRCIWAGPRRTLMPRRSRIRSK